MKDTRPPALFSELYLREKYFSNVSIRHIIEMSGRLQEIKWNTKAVGKGKLSTIKHKGGYKMTAHTEKSRWGDYVSSLVYGGLDGIITTFAVVSGVAGASLAPEIIIILGFSNLFADGFSMAVGDYLSSKSTYEYENHVRVVDRRAIEEDFQMETERLTQDYIRQGMSEEDARQVSRTFAKYPEVMTNQRLGEEEIVSKSQPFKNALVTFLSFAIFGAVPLLIYVVAMIRGELLENAFVVASVMTGITLFMLGVAKSKVTRANWFKSGLEMFVVGGLAAFVAYGIGFILGN